MRRIVYFLFLSAALMQSCFLIKPDKDTLENRISKNKIAIANSDYNKMLFDGVYFSAYANPHNNNKLQYQFYKFFRNGSAYRGPNFYSLDSLKNGIGILNGEWLVYYLKDDKLFIEEYNSYNNVYYTINAKLSKDSTQLTFDYADASKATEARVFTYEYFVFEFVSK